MIGHEFLISKIRTRMMPLQQPARIKPVTRVESLPEMLAVPRSVAPADDNILNHVLFALRYGVTVSHRLPVGSGDVMDGRQR